MVPLGIHIVIMRITNEILFLKPEIYSRLTLLFDPYYKQLLYLFSNYNTCIYVASLANMLKFCLASLAYSVLTAGNNHFLSISMYSHIYSPCHYSFLVRMAIPWQSSLNMAMSLQISQHLLDLLNLCKSESTIHLKSLPNNFLYENEPVIFGTYKSKFVFYIGFITASREYSS